MAVGPKWGRPIGFNRSWIMLDYLANYGQQDISIASLTFSIVVASLIDIGVVQIYRSTHRGLNYDRSFLITLLLTGPIIALIITIIGNNIALSIGLVVVLPIRPWSWMLRKVMILITALA